ncbi:hypothetical protein GMRT_15543 [Giardia muris]|uniref:Uncharacterized protein n=1 Tax=Giardia muris TaxID=5742 RepID=A0A4Z1SVC0_GIAMU|nr:hypothetical protein GMRT_15543 [Giardia muris]|eukprot:TNJ28865.1 hypothetical protein GMRT_15543 [Giardia muris]
MIGTRLPKLSPTFYEITKRSLLRGASVAAGSLAGSLIRARHRRPVDARVIQDAARLGVTAALSAHISECAHLAIDERTGTYGVLNDVAAATTGTILTSQILGEKLTRREALGFPLRVLMHDVLETRKPLHSSLPERLNAIYGRVRGALGN